MSRTLGAANRNNIEFLKKFDAFSRAYIDPMELLFQIASKSKKCGTGWSNSERLSSASTLMQYRYPRLKALEIQDNTDAPNIQISWLDHDGDEIKAPEIDTDPQATLLQ